MKTRMAETSLQAFEATNKSRDKSIILRCLTNYGYLMSAKRIADLTGLDLETVNGRIYDLRYKHGLIVADGVGNKRTLYRLRRPDEAPDVQPLSKHQKLYADIVLLAETLQHSDNINTLQAQLNLILKYNE